MSSFHDADRSEMAPLGYEAVPGSSETWRHEVAPLLRWLYQATPLDRALVALAPGLVDWSSSLHDADRSEFRLALARAIDVWNEYENGDAGWSFDEADAILAMPEMEAIRSALFRLARFYVRQQGGDIEGPLINYGLPDHVVAWVMKPWNDMLAAMGEP